MTREELRERARAEWRSFYPADKGKGTKAGIICPLCGNGSGTDGTGITENPKKAGALMCFKCGFQGDILDLLQLDKHTDYNGALSIAEAILGVTVDSPAAVSSFTGKKGEANRATQTAAQQLDQTPQDYTEYYKARCIELLNSPAALEYIQKRGITPETARAYWIGYDPRWQSPQALRNGSNPPESPRIILPCNRAQYEARALENGGKYAKMNEGGKGLFNLKLLKDQSKEPIFIVEGIFDALAIIEAGGRAIALNSTANREKFVENLKLTRPVAPLIIATDNDEAGKTAAQKLEKDLNRLNISNTRADICGKCKDPNEALTTDRAAFIAAIRAAENAAKGKPDNSADYIAQKMGEDIARLAAARDKKTGFKNLDYKTGGLFAGLYVIAAISSLGKTTFAAQIADQLAEAGEDVLFFSLEMSRLEMISKSISRTANKSDFESPLTSLSIRRGLYPDQTRAAAADYVQSVGDRISIVEGNFNCDISFIGSYIRGYIERTGKRPTVFIDYLQILQADSEKGTKNTTRETVDSAITELKRISREMDITVFVISSVNRANYLTPIDFESLKESGGIEYTADVIFGLQLACLSTDEVFEAAANTKIKAKRETIKAAKSANPRKIELVCLKNRYGIANFSSFFDYYPAQDLFREDNEANRAAEEQTATAQNRSRRKL